MGPGKLEELLRRAPPTTNKEELGLRAACWAALWLEGKRSEGVLGEFFRAHNAHVEAILARARELHPEEFEETEEDRERMEDLHRSLDRLREQWAEKARMERERAERWKAEQAEQRRQAEERASWPWWRRWVYWWRLRKQTFHEKLSGTFARLRHSDFVPRLIDVSIVLVSVIGTAQFVEWLGFDIEDEDGWGRVLLAYGATAVMVALLLPLYYLRRWLEQQGHRRRF